MAFSINTIEFLRKILCQIPSPSIWDDVPDSHPTSKRQILINEIERLKVFKFMPHIISPNHNDLHQLKLKFNEAVFEDNAFKGGIF